MVMQDKGWQDEGWQDKAGQDKAGQDKAGQDRVAQDRTAPPAPNGAGSQIRWIETDMRTAFANVVNVQSTREQFDLFFGTNQTWNPEQGGDITVSLSNRVMLSPFAAKRLAGVLSSVLSEYEQRFGTIAVTP